MSSNLMYSVIVPVYDSAASVVELVDRTRRVFAGIDEACEIILVDDGSTNPESWATLQGLARNNPNVRSIRLMRNYGKARAILCGLQAAAGAWMITIDDDLQQRPEDIPTLIGHRDHDVVVAQFGKRHHGALAVLTSAVKSRFDHWILGLPCKMSPFKLFSVKVAREMLAIRSARPFIPALMAHVTNDFYPVEVTHQPSAVGRTRYTLGRRLAKFTNLIIGNSSLLLRGLGWVGLSFALAGFIYAAHIVYRYFSGSAPVPGWSSLIVINLLFGGLLLISLSLVGDYLHRILHQVTPRPLFVIREECGSDPEQAERSEPPEGTTGSQRASAFPETDRC